MVRGRNFGGWEVVWGEAIGMVVDRWYSDCVMGEVDWWMAGGAVAGVGSRLFDGLVVDGI